MLGIIVILYSRVGIRVRYNLNLDVFVFHILLTCMIIKSEESIPPGPADTEALRCRQRHLSGVCQGDRDSVQTPTAAEGRHRVERNLERIFS